MKKILFYSLSIAFCTILITSCKKPTKGKIVNEWTVRSYRETTDYGVFTLFDSPGSPNKFTIKKNGTWVWTWEKTYHGAIYGGSVQVTSKVTTTQEGTWSLAKADGDKNKRLTFNTLSETEYNETTYSSMNELFPDYSGSTSKTYAAGEKTTTYNILESTNKRLKLEGKNSELDPANGTTLLIKIEITLEED
ncbi:hypothetical protein D3C87_26860 [compost metagenome]